MSSIIADLFSQVQSDPWRQEVGFSADLKDAHIKLSEAGDDEEKIIAILSKWLQRFQPCLFGRLAARLNLLNFCVLNEEDLNDSDEKIQNKILSARLKWTKEAFEGKKSGFILFVNSRTITNSIPNDTLMSIAKQICSYYLMAEIEQDVIYTDEIFLEKPGHNKVTWKWNAGVNYFCANADLRWWQDHRIPGGLAFSTNSVGHMAKAGGIANLMNELNEIVGVKDEKFIASNVDSLDQALEFAMRTIDMASDSVSGKATELLSSRQGEEAHTCPITLPKQLVGRDCRQYKGYYHTDITIPSEYFTSDVERPQDCKIHMLDFTYLYEQDLRNPDFVTMGKGRQIRESLGQNAYSPNIKLAKSLPIEEKISPGSRLYNAIKS